MAVAEHCVSFLVLIVWVYFDILLGDMQQKSSVVVDEFGHSHCAGLVDCFPMNISILAKDSGSIGRIDQCLRPSAIEIRVCRYYK